jgi:ABC-type Fe3+ transport system permease subunit
MSDNGPYLPAARSTSSEGWWFWWGMAWGAAASVFGCGTLFFHWKAESLLRAGSSGIGSLGEAFSNSMMAAVLGVPLTVVCSIVFVGCWARWLSEVANRRRSRSGGMP